MALYHPPPPPPATWTQSQPDKRLLPHPGTFLKLEVSRNQKLNNYSEAAILQHIQRRLDVLPITICRFDEIHSRKCLSINHLLLKQQPVGAASTMRFMCWKTPAHKVKNSLYSLWWICIKHNVPKCNVQSAQTAWQVDLQSNTSYKTQSLLLAFYYYIKSECSFPQKS